MEGRLQGFSCKDASFTPCTSWLKDVTSWEIRRLDQWIYNFSVCKFRPGLAFLWTSFFISPVSPFPLDIRNVCVVSNNLLAWKKQIIRWTSRLMANLDTWQHRFFVCVSFLCYFALVLVIYIEAYLGCVEATESHCFHHFDFLLTFAFKLGSWKKQNDRIFQRTTKI